jgi:hypothetical protein
MVHQILGIQQGLAGGAGAREHPGVSGPSGMGQEDPTCLLESGENNYLTWMVGHFWESWAVSGL